MRLPVLERSAPPAPAANCTFAQVDNNTCAAWVTASNALSKLGVETFRKIVKDALATW